MPEDTPDNDPEKSLRKQNERLRRENERLQHENELLRQKVNHLIRHVFGRRSEKQDSGQLELLLRGKPHEPVQTPESQGAAKELLKETPARSGGKRKPRAPRIPENLPVEEVCVDPEEVLASPEALRCIGEVVSWFPGRGHDCLKQIVPQTFRGTLQCDGYGAYETFGGTREALERAVRQEDRDARPGLLLSMAHVQASNAPAAQEALDRPALSIRTSHRPILNCRSPYFSSERVRDRFQSAGSWFNEQMP